MFLQRSPRNSKATEEGKGTMTTQKPQFKVKSGNVPILPEGSLRRFNS